MENSYGKFISNSINRHFDFFHPRSLWKYTFIVSILKNIDNRKHSKIIIREMLIVFFILVTFLFFGEKFLNMFHLETQAITIAGGIIFFVISLKRIFPSPDGAAMFSPKDDSDPLVVPIAVPVIVGPAALATLLVLAKTNSDHYGGLFISLLLAWGLYQRK